jgi:DNA-binding LytR/AlgR family response regulator
VKRANRGRKGSGPSVASCDGMVREDETAWAAPLVRISARRRSNIVFLEPSEVWAFEADARLTFVHSARGKLDIDVSLAELEASPLRRLFARVHRGWLANVELVKAIEYDAGVAQLLVGTKGVEGSGIRVPVSRSLARPVREMLLAGAIGVRRRDTSRGPFSGGALDPEPLDELGGDGTILDAAQ